MTNKQTARALGKTIALLNNHTETQTVQFLQIFCNFSGITAQQSFVRTAMQEWHEGQRKNKQAVSN